MPIPPKRSCDIHTTRICKLFIHSQSQRDLVRSIYIYNRSGIDQFYVFDNAQKVENKNKSKFSLLIQQRKR